MTFSKFKVPALAGLLASATLSLQPVLAADVSLDMAVATVNGETLTVGDLLALKDTLPAEYQNAPVETLLPQLLDQLIDQELLAESFNDDGPIAEYIIDGQERLTKASLAIEDAANGADIDARIEALYDELISQAPDQTEWNAAHILVESEEKAKELVTELEAGADFKELATTESTGPSGPDGGDLGWFSAGQMVPEFETAVQDLEIGQVSAPIQTQFGWHVIKLNDERIAEKPTLEEVRGQIEPMAQQAIIQETIEAARDAGEIEQVADLAPSIIAGTLKEPNPPVVEEPSEPQDDTETTQ